MDYSVKKSGIRSAAKVQITYVPISALKSDPRNPRKHTPKQIAQIATSIRQFGFVAPILIDSKKQIIAGHCRTEAGKQVGITEVPTVMLAHLTPEQARALAIADNQLATVATWDPKLLGEQLKFLSELELDFKLEDLGFETAEIDLLIEGVEPVLPAKADPADEVPGTSGPAVCKLGDLWQLGRHRVVCGDACSEETIRAVLNGDTAAMVITDVPYNVKVKGHIRGKGAIRHREFPMASGEMKRGEYTDFLTRVLTLLAQFSDEGALQYHFIDWRHLPEMLSAGEAAYDAFVNLCVWAKPSGGMGSFYRSAHELVCIFRHGHTRNRNNIQLGRFGRNRTNVWSYPSPTAFGGGGEERDLVQLHATPKPVQLIADAILDASGRNDVVVDVFLGSGTTLIAAERTGRICYGVELDPLYVDLIIRRWQRFTGEQARHIASARTFCQIATRLARKGGRHG